MQNEKSPLDRDCQDPLQDFFDDMLIFADTASVPAGELRASYEDYLRAAGVKSALNLRAFNQRLKARGCIWAVKRYGSSIDEPAFLPCWVGVTLKTNLNNRLKFDKKTEV